MSRALSKKEQQQQLQHQAQQARDVETQEHRASANASAGLNLNLFGALSGALSSSKRKETHTSPEGNRHTIEDSHDQAAASGLASGQANAYAQGAAQNYGKRETRRAVGQMQEQGRVAHKEVDHLGIEK